MTQCQFNSQLYRPLHVKYCALIIFNCTKVLQYSCTTYYRTRHVDSYCKHATKVQLYSCTYITQHQWLASRRGEEWVSHSAAGLGCHWHCTLRHPFWMCSLDVLDLSLLSALWTAMAAAATGFSLPAAGNSLLRRMDGGASLLQAHSLNMASSQDRRRRGPPAPRRAPAWLGPSAPWVAVFVLIAMVSLNLLSASWSPDPEAG